MNRERLSPVHIFEELQLRPPAEGDPWQRSSPDELTSSGERKRVRVVRCLKAEKDDKAVMRIVIVDDFGDSPKTRRITLKNFVEKYEPSDEILSRYDHICRARPVRTRLSGPSGSETHFRRVLNAAKRPKGRLERAAGVRRRPR